MPIVAPNPAPGPCGNKRTPTGTVTCQRPTGHDTTVLNHAARNTAGSLLNWGVHT